MLYRIVHRCPESTADESALGEFETQRARGIDEPIEAAGPEALWSWRFGVSTYSTLSKARKRAKASVNGPRPLGQFVATLHIPVLGAPILIVKTGGSNHFDLVGSASAILATVVNCVGV